MSGATQTPSSSSDSAETLVELVDEELVFDDLDGTISENLLQDDFVKEALREGVDLREYALQVQDDLKRAESVSIQDYVAESSTLAGLHCKIEECDDILAKMEALLSGFQKDLTDVSAEIETLQQQSIAMERKLQNRKLVEPQLTQFVTEMVVPPDLITNICEMEMSEHYLEKVKLLQRKLDFYNGSAEAKSAKCANDVGPQLALLCTKATEKIRDFLLEQIYAPRKERNPVVSQQVLLKYHTCNEFLRKNNKDVANEILHDYIETHWRVHLTYFKEYITHSMKLEVSNAPDKHDLLGVNDNAKKGLFTLPSALLAKTRPSGSAFVIGTRQHILSSHDTQAIVPAHARQKGTKYTFEVIFNSIMVVLMDHACAEYDFCRHFFGLKGSPLMELFAKIYDPVIALYKKKIEGYVSECYDTLVMMMCIGLMDKYRRVMQQRRIPCLDMLLEWCGQIFWPRLKIVLDLHTASLKETSDDVFSNVDIRPHYIVRRYAELVVGTAVIEAEMGRTDREAPALFLSALQRVSVEVENLVLKMAAEFTSRRGQLVFVINNYDLVISTVMESCASQVSVVDHLRDTLAKNTKDFVDLELENHFQEFIGILKEERASGTDTVITDERLGAVVRNFNETWLGHVDAIHTDVIKYFTNFNNGNKILQAVYTSLLVHYKEFVDFLGQPKYKRSPARRETLSVQQVMVAIKKKKTTF